MLYIPEDVEIHPISFFLNFENINVLRRTSYPYSRFMNASLKKKGGRKLARKKDVTHLASVKAHNNRWGSLLAVISRR